MDSSNLQVVQKAGFIDAVLTSQFAARERILTIRWGETIERCEKLLEPNDLEHVKRITLWDLVQNEILEAASAISGRSKPYKIEPALGNVCKLATIVESRFGVSPKFFRGIIGLLVKVSSHFHAHPLCQDHSLTPTSSLHKMCKPYQNSHGCSRIWATGPRLSADTAMLLWRSWAR